MRKLITIAATALALQSAWANNTYTVEVPTDDPYTRIDAGTGYGAFTDTVNFELDQPYTGLVWLLPRNGGLNFLFDNINDASLTLRNDTTGQTWLGESYATAVGKVSTFNLQALALDLVGFDVNKSLIITGDFDAGDYSALISGKATGLLGGTYVAKFGFTQAIPEPGTSALMLLGLAGIGLVASRRRTH